MNLELSASFKMTGCLNNQFDTVSLLDLLTTNQQLVLHIPAYQRGYRWRLPHVRTLIADLCEFYDNSSVTDKYPLQPIVLKQTHDINGDAIPYHFDVVDGQQRLTTIYQLLSAWNYRWCAGHKDWRLWAFEYDEISNANNWSLSEASKVNTRIVARQCSEEQIDHIVSLIADRRIYFLYYLLCRDSAKNETPHEVFLRLNDGKIALTDSELIRALFWNKQVAVDEAYSRNQIAAEWEQIEQLCRDPGFWSMISRSRYKSFTRIDRLFEILCGTGDAASKDPMSRLTFERFNSDVRAKDGKVDSEKLLCKWQELVELCWTLQGWYQDVELYHYVCWLARFGMTCKGERFRIENIYEDYRCDCRNTERLKSKLRAEIYTDGKDGRGLALLHLARNPQNEDGIDFSPQELTSYYRKYSGIPYAYPGASNLGIWMPYGNVDLPLVRNQEKLRALLVLFNIESINAGYRKAISLLQRQNASIIHDRWDRFPFELFDSERMQTGWDIEHVSPQTTNAMESIDEQILWAVETVLESAINSDVCSECDCESIKKWLSSVPERKVEDVCKQYHIDYRMTSCHCNDGISFDKIYFGNAHTDITDDIWHDRVGNLALLDKKTNILNENSIFPKKRRIVRDVVMGRDAIGTKQEHRFVPACTVKVFMKFYTRLSTSNSKWLIQDILDYEDEMRTVLGEAARRVIEGA